MSDEAWKNYQESDWWPETSTETMMEDVDIYAGLCGSSKQWAKDDACVCRSESKATATVSVCGTVLGYKCAAADAVYDPNNPDKMSFDSGAAYLAAGLVLAASSLF